MASPFWPKASKQSFMAFSIGILRVMAEASPPSASNHFAPGFKPTSFRMVDKGMPTHSEVEVKPWVPCTVFILGSTHSVRPFPEHSMNIMRETKGKRRNDSIEKFCGLFTMPCTYNMCLVGSMLAIPPWCRSKCKPDGVIIPMLFCKGVKLHDDSAVLV